MLVFEAGSWAKYGAKCGLKSKTLKHKQGTPEIVHRSYSSLNLLFGKGKYLGISQTLVGLEQTNFKQYVFKLWNSLLLNDSACWKFAWVQKEILKVLVEEKLFIIMPRHYCGLICQWAANELSLQHVLRKCLNILALPHSLPIRPDALLWGRWYWAKRKLQARHIPSWNQ